MSSVFISYSHKDKLFVKRLAVDLRDSGHTAWIDETEILVGDSLIDKIRDIIDNVDFVIAILSSTSIDSEFVKKELDLASNREIDEKRVVVLPILLDDVKLPGFLKGKYYIDCRKEDDYQDCLSALLKRLGPSTPTLDLSTDRFIMRPYLRIATPSHSWLRVPISELEQLGIYNEISEYSYQDNLYGYLEEDDDEMKFAEAKERRHGSNYNLDEDTFTLFINDFPFNSIVSKFAIDIPKERKLCAETLHKKTYNGGATGERSSKPQDESMTKHTTNGWKPLQDIRRRWIMIVLALIPIIGSIILYTARSLQTSELSGKLVNISYNPKEEFQVIREFGEDPEVYRGVSYFATAHLLALKKNFIVNHVRVLIALKTGTLREGKFLPASPPPPNSDDICIQYLTLLEKDKLCVCYINFLLEGEQREELSNMDFTRIELRLYDKKGRYKTIDLFASDVPQF
jgi:hypothetical protein